jgi:hypothetical protein
MKLIATQNRRRRINHNKFVEIKKGMEYDSNSKLVKQFPSSCFIKKPQGPKESYTKEEHSLLLELYIKYSDPINSSDNRFDIIDEFRKVFQTHSRGSLEMTVNQLKNMDNPYNADGLKTVSPQLRRLAQEKYPDRFIIPGPTILNHFEESQEESVPDTEVVHYFPNRLTQEVSY